MGVLAHLRLRFAALPLLTAWIQGAGAPRPPFVSPTELFRRSLGVSACKSIKQFSTSWKSNMLHEYITVPNQEGL